MNRAVDRLRGGPFDLLVIGGGVYGAWIAYDAALRGLQVALVERGDWASGTSSGSSKLIHGGLRYLERGRVGLVRKSLDERRRLHRLAPHRVWPLRMVMPSYRGDRVGPFRIGVGLWIYDRLAGGNQPVDDHRRWSRERLLEAYGFLRADGLRGGFTFGDCGTDDARFTLELIDGALRAGAAAVSRVEALRWVEERGRVVGAELLDRIDGNRIPLRSRVVVHCGGPFVSQLFGETPPPTARTRLSKGVHLVLPALETEDALIAPTSDGRIIFLIPWYGRTLLGTTDTDVPGEPSTPRASRTDTDYLLTEAARVLGRPFSTDQVVGSFAALRALAPDGGGDSASVSREWLLTEPVAGVLASIGGKFTSARSDAALAVDRVERMLGRTPSGCATDDRPFPWAPEAPFGDWSVATCAAGTALGLDPETAAACARRYGSRIELLWSLLRENPEHAARIDPELPFCMAEPLFAVRHEMALDLADVLRRRVPLMLLGSPPDDRLATIAGLVAGEAGWDDARTREEIERVGGTQGIEVGS